MSEAVSDRIREAILEKRAHLAKWLEASQPEGRARALGPMTEQAVQEHLAQLDQASEQALAGDLGICEVCHEPVERALLEMDYTACVCLDHLSEPEMRDLERELELAQGVQRELLPQEVPEIPGLQIAAYSRPAQIVSGDFFDFPRFEDGRAGVVVADVAGHGLSASLHMAGLQSMLRALVPVSHSPGEVLARVHRLYRHNFRFTTFVSVFLMALDSARGELTYVNAGHNPPVLARSTDGGVDWLMPTGPALGLTEEAEYPERMVPLRPGDALVLYTDGIPEAFDPAGQQFGQERLEAALRRAAGAPAPQVVHVLREALQDFVGEEPLTDDITLIVLRGTGGYITGTNSR
jgi:serine phosphatase RsbU (regulator of sigma subunit)